MTLPVDSTWLIQLVADMGIIQCFVPYASEEDMTQAHLYLKVASDYFCIASTKLVL